MDPMRSGPPGGDQSRAATLIAISWIGAGLSTFLVGCRVFTRLRLTRNAGVDDVIIVFSSMLNIICTAITTVSTYTGIGRHQFYLLPAQISKAVYLNLIAQPFGVMGVCLPKIAVAILIVRLMGPHKHGVWFLYASTLSLTFLSMLCAIFLFAQCSPSAALWNPAIPAKCWPPAVISNFTTVVGAYSAFCDLSLAIFPISVFWNLKLKVQKKIGICTVMGLGVIACVCAVFKTTQLRQLGAKSDYTWDMVDLILWTLVEVSVIIICACIPTLRPLILLLTGKGTAPTRGRAKYAGPTTYGNSPFTDKLSACKGRSNGSSDQYLINENHFPIEDIKRTIDIETRSESV